jgi:uncharacterized protein YdhG (YjbR/CyaY superfamily)
MGQLFNDTGFAGILNPDRTIALPEKKPADIDAYIANAPHHVRPQLESIRATIQKNAPDAAEAIRYGIPTFVQGENLVHFAGFRNHIGFYPTPSAISAFRERLSGYKSAKGSVQFPLDDPMPLDLIAEIVRFRLDEVSKKTA